MEMVARKKFRYSVLLVQRNNMRENLSGTVHALHCHHIKDQSPSEPCYLLRIQTLHHFLPLRQEDLLLCLRSCDVTMVFQKQASFRFQSPQQLKYLIFLRLLLVLPEVKYKVIRISYIELNILFYYHMYHYCKKKLISK